MFCLPGKVLPDLNPYDPFLTYLKSITLHTFLQLHVINQVLLRIDRDHSHLLWDEGFLHYTHNVGETFQEKYLYIVVLSHAYAVKTSKYQINLL